MSPSEHRSVTIQCCDEKLRLLCERALFWPRTSTLFVADVHAGKEHVFGRTGIAIPGGISESTLQQLFDLVDTTGAERLIVLGDFFHAMPKRSEHWLCALSEHLDERVSLSMSIVAGNHDKPAGRSLIDSRICWITGSEVEGPFVLQHEPGTDDRGYVLAGHLHPAWRVGRSRRGGIRAPVFWFGEQGAVLPAFGEFTGGQTINPEPGDRLFMTGPNCVLQVPAPKAHRY